MEPDVVEIAPPLFPSGSRTRKPRKAGIPEVIDVEHYEFRNGGLVSNNNNANLVDKKNKGKSIQDGSFYDHLADEEVVMSTTHPWGFPSSSSKRSRRSSSRPFNRDASASSSPPRAAVEVVVSSAQANFLRDFKRFDTVDNFSQHHYASQGNASKQHSRTWVKKVQADWKILEIDLPEAISVRACESRMDLMRAVIVGAEGTPYHDGLFFFDIHFPDTYPSVPPMVHYHSGGLRINPNLYNCGKVCLSLLGTWNGNAREQWLPQESTMLQLLVSIQALILNQKPYFNEPAYGRTKGTPSGEAHSKFYSENVYVLSLRTMVYSMRKPPKHFEEFVRSHYFERAHDIVKASNAYIDGAPVGSIVKGGVQDIEESSESGSMKFRTEVATFMKTVVEELVKLGVKELDDKLKPPPNAESSNKSNCKRSRSSRLSLYIYCFVVVGYLVVTSKNFSRILDATSHLTRTE